MYIFTPNTLIESGKINSNFTELNSYFTNTDTGWITPTYLNGWVDYDTTYNSLAYRKDPFGYVHLKGMVKSGTIGANIFVLPTGFRPLRRYLITVTSAAALGRLDIVPDGSVFPNVGSNIWFSLDNVHFKAEA